MSRKPKQHDAAIYKTSWGEAAVVYEKDRHGNPVARVVGFRANKRSWRYWRAVGLALAATVKAKFRG